MVYFHRCTTGSLGLRRWGFAIAVYDAPRSSGALSKVWVLGGDDYQEPLQTLAPLSGTVGGAPAPALPPKQWPFWNVNDNPNDAQSLPTGGGGYNNDVWIWRVPAGGASGSWESFTDYRNTGTHGEPVASLVSAVKWTQQTPQQPQTQGGTGSGATTPNMLRPSVRDIIGGGGYREWLCCLSGQAWFPCANASVCVPSANSTGGVVSSSRSSSTTAPGPRRWSPRRNHAAIGIPRSTSSSNSVNATDSSSSGDSGSSSSTSDGSAPILLIIMGGRARSLEEMPREDGVGGLPLDMVESMEEELDDEAGDAFTQSLLLSSGLDGYTAEVERRRRALQRRNTAAASARGNGGLSKGAAAASAASNLHRRNRLRGGRNSASPAARLGSRSSGGVNVARSQDAASASWSSSRSHLSLGSSASRWDITNGRQRPLPAAVAQRQYRRLQPTAALNSTSTSAADVNATAAAIAVSQSSLGSNGGPIVYTHEASVLMSDVWMSSDDGASWTLVNPGCYVPQLEHSTFPPPASYSCSADVDCYARRLGNAGCVDGVCVCRHWSPRERFALAAGTPPTSTSFQPLIIAGGLTYRHRGLCGAWACSGWYPLLLNDVWISRNGGASWAMQTPHASWSPRMDHAMALIRMPLATQPQQSTGGGIASGNAVDVLWLIGGRGKPPRANNITAACGAPGTTLARAVSRAPASANDSIVIPADQPGAGFLSPLSHASTSSTASTSTSASSSGSIMDPPASCAAYDPDPTGGGADGLASFGDVFVSGDDGAHWVANGSASSSSEGSSVRTSTQAGGVDSPTGGGVTAAIASASGNTASALAAQAAALRAAGVSISASGSGSSGGSSSSGGSTSTSGGTSSAPYGDASPWGPRSGLVLVANGTRLWLLGGMAQVQLPRPPPPALAPAQAQIAAANAPTNLATGSTVNVLAEAAVAAEAARLQAAVSVILPSGTGASGEVYSDAWVTLPLGDVWSIDVPVCTSAGCAGGGNSGNGSSAALTDSSSGSAVLSALAQGYFTAANASAGAAAAAAVLSATLTNGANSSTISAAAAAATTAATAAAAALSVVTPTLPWETYRAGALNAWFQDFAPPAPSFALFFHPSMALSAPQFNLSSGIVTALAAFSVHTWAQLSELPDATVSWLTTTRSALSGWPVLMGGLARAGDGVSPCYMRVLARTLCWKCSVHRSPYDGEWFFDGYTDVGTAAMQSNAIIAAAAAAAAAAAGESGGSGSNGGDAGAAVPVCGGASLPPIADADADIPCRASFSPRWSPKAFMLQGSLFVLGGQGSSNAPASNDLWYRDDTVPSTFLTAVPPDASSSTMISFACSEPACVFECRVTDVAGPYLSARLLRNWTRCASPYETLGINGPKRRTRFEVRATDAAGNLDQSLTYYYIGTGGAAMGNVYEWTYVPPLPILLIALVCAGCVLFLVLLFVGYRRYRNAQMLQRYLDKRAARRLRVAKTKLTGDGEEMMTGAERRRRKKMGGGGGGGAAASGGGGTGGGGGGGFNSAAANVPASFWSRAAGSLFHRGGASAASTASAAASKKKASVAVVRVGGAAASAAAATTTTLQGPSAGLRARGVAAGGGRRTSTVSPAPAAPSRTNIANSKATAEPPSTVWAGVTATANNSVLPPPGPAAAASGSSAAGTTSTSFMTIKGRGRGGARVGVAAPTPSSSGTTAAVTTATTAASPPRQLKSNPRGDIADTRFLVGATSSSTSTGARPARGDAYWGRAGQRGAGASGTATAAARSSSVSAAAAAGGDASAATTGFRTDGAAGAAFAANLTPAAKSPAAASTTKGGGYVDSRPIPAAPVLFNDRRPRLRSPAGGLAQQQALLVEAQQQRAANGGQRQQQQQQQQRTAISPAYSRVPARDFSVVSPARATAASPSSSPRLGTVSGGGRSNTPGAGAAAGVGSPGGARFRSASTASSAAAGRPAAFQSKRE